MGFTISLPGKVAAAHKPQKGNPVSKAKVLSTAPADEHELSFYADLIDETGRLHCESLEIEAQILELRKRLEPLSEKMAELRLAMDDLHFDPDATRIEYGKSFKVTLGTQGTSRAISDMDEVKAILGTEVFMQLASVKLSDVDKYLTQAQRDNVIETTRTKRNLKILPRK